MDLTTIVIGNPLHLTAYKKEINDTLENKPNDI